MHRSTDTATIDTIAEHFSKHRYVILNRDATRRIFPNLDEAIRRYNGALPSAFSVTQDGYEIKNVRVLTYSGAAYVVDIHYMQKQDEPQEKKAPAPHRRRSA